jgi:SAM-dependent methyltransferase
MGSLRLPFLEKIIGRIRADRRKRIRRLAPPAWLGSIRRTTPLSDHYGYDRGTPVDRYYIERFLEEYRRDVHGRVLEVKDSSYTDRYGFDVEQRDVLDVDPANPHATIIADLASADSMPSHSFDCFILTQTLQLIYDMRGAISHAHRILRPGGALLVTVPAVSRVVPGYGFKTDYWRFTAASCSSLFGEVFGAEQVTSTTVVVDV